MTPEDRHAAETEFLNRTGNAVDELLTAKDFAAACADPAAVRDRLSAITALIHELQDASIPGFGAARQTSTEGNADNV